jgi:3-keto-disaccharide hydrolase
MIIAQRFLANAILASTVSRQLKLSNFISMKRFGLLISASLLFSAGCASHPSQSSSHTSQAPSTSAATAPQHAPTDTLKDAAAKPSEPFEGEGWVSFFDGKTLAGWSETDFAGHGRVEVDSGLIVLNTGDPLTGINWTNRVPNINYEVALDAMRVTGSDFFCGLTVPVSNSFCTLIVGGWGGSLVGISSLDGQDASENETTKFHNAEQGRWYRIRLRVTQLRIEAWIDKQKFVDVDTTDRRISLRAGEIESSKPFGIASYQTTAALREIKLRRVSGPADPLKKRY